MNLEIEIRSPDAKNDIYELRNYLQQQLSDIQVQIREEKPEEGQMSIGVVAHFVLDCVLHVAGTITLEHVYTHYIKPNVAGWIQNRRKKQAMSGVQVDTTIRENKNKTHFREDENGRSQVFSNVHYAIDTDRTRAVLIGVSEFDNGFSSIPPVKGNMEDMFALLTDKAHIGLPVANVAVAYNKTNTEIEELLLRTSRQPGIETLLIYFAGHGYRSDTKKLYLVARNTRKVDDYILGGLDFDFINNAVLNTGGARQKIMIMDACHSGIATQGGQDLVASLDVKGTYILASSPGDEASYFKSSDRNTYFTGVLIDLLKKGVDNTQEMLALDDLYDYSKDWLSRKNFPEPNYKNDLNIPSARFFIAHNPSFSPEKLKHKARQLAKLGKPEDALYEYRLLLQRYPDDLQLRNEAAECEVQALFSRLVQEGDEYYFQQRNFNAAIDKYRKALQLKDDVIVLGKINKCEDWLRTGEQPKPKPEADLRHQHQTEKILHKEKEIKQEEPVRTKPVAFEKPVTEKKMTTTESTGQPETAQFSVSSRQIRIFIALAWFIIGFMMHYSKLNALTDDTSYKGMLSTLSTPFFLVALVGVVITWKLMSNWEMLIWANGILLLSVMVMVPVVEENNNYLAGLALLLPVLLAYLYLIYKKLHSLTVAEFIVASIGILYYTAIVVGVGSLPFIKDMLKGNNYQSWWPWVNLLPGIAIIILLARKRNKIRG